MSLDNKCFYETNYGCHRFILSVLRCHACLWQVVAGKAAYDGYAEHLRSIGEPFLPHEGLLWILRIGLLIAVFLHVTCAIHLIVKSKLARKSKYKMKKGLRIPMRHVPMRIGGAFMFSYNFPHLHLRVCILN